MTDFKADDARQLLDNPIFVDAMFNIRENVITQLEILPPNNDRIRDELVISLQMLVAIKEQIKSHIDTEALNAGQDEGQER